MSSKYSLNPKVFLRIIHTIRLKKGDREFERAQKKKQNKTKGDKKKRHPVY